MIEASMNLSHPLPEFSDPIEYEIVHFINENNIVSQRGAFFTLEPNDSLLNINADELYVYTKLKDACLVFVPCNNEWQRIPDIIENILIFHSSKFRIRNIATDEYTNTCFYLDAIITT
jgi:hypothetical protein